MKKLVYLSTIFFLSLSANAQNPVSPPQAGQRVLPEPDRIIAIETGNTSLVLKVSSRDSRLYQSYFGPRFGSRKLQPAEE